MNVYPFCPLRQIAAFHLLISQATPFSDEACETNHSLKRTESCWKTGKRFFRTVCSHLVLCFNMSPRCVRAMGFRPALALFGDAKQAMRGKVVRLKLDRWLRPWTSNTYSSNLLSDSVLLWFRLTGCISILYT